MSTTIGLTIALHILATPVLSVMITFYICLLVNGSEDIALFPNKQAIISSGLYFNELADLIKKPVPKLYMFDFNKPELGPIELEMDIDQKQFNPHGVGHWVTPDGDYYLYVISHLEERDRVESFYFNVEEKKLHHRGSYAHPILRQMNDIVIVGFDEFYVTVDHYFSNPTIKSIESLVRLPLCSVVYFNAVTKTAKVAAGGLTYPNGIAKSNNGRYVYVSNIGAGEILVYKQNKDNSLAYTQTIRLRHAVDNIFVDPTNGHMWVAVFPVPMNVLKYILDRSYPVEGRIFHITISESEEEPFSYTQSKIEEIFETDGTEFGGISIAVFCDNKLLLGTIGHDMMLCGNVDTLF